MEKSVQKGEKAVSLGVSPITPRRELFAKTPGKLLPIRPAQVLLREPIKIQEAYRPPIPPLQPTNFVSKPFSVKASPAIIPLVKRSSELTNSAPKNNPLMIKQKVPLPIRSANDASETLKDDRVALLIGRLGDEIGSLSNGVDNQRNEVTELKRRLSLADCLI